MTLENSSNRFKNLMKARSSLELINSLVLHADNFDFKYCQEDNHIMRIDIKSKFKQQNSSNQNEFGYSKTMNTNEIPFLKDIGDNSKTFKSMRNINKAYEGYKIDEYLLTQELKVS